VLNDSRARTELRCQVIHVGDGAEVAIENHVARVGTGLRASSVLAVVARAQRRRTRVRRPQESAGDAGEGSGRFVSRIARANAKSGLVQRVLQIAVVEAHPPGFVTTRPW
jgi:hypothetical protein